MERSDVEWALPQGPNCRAGAISTAIEMEDHRREYLLFEGVHETGPIMLWDRGTWEPYPVFDDVEGSLRRGIMRFTLHGEKLRGGWALARTNSARNASRPIWTLSKLADSFAESANKNILEEQPNSVTTARTIEEIVRDWTRPKTKRERQTKLFNDL